MTIEFYTYSGDNRKIDKSSGMVLGMSKQCSIYQQTGIMHPSLVMTYSDSIVNYNYFHIPKWHRYYFITGMEVLPGGRIIITGSEDVLFSNKDAILELDVYVNRTEGNNFNKLIVDNNFPSQANRHCKTLSFSLKPFSATDTDACYLLTVVGGQPDEVE